MAYRQLITILATALCSVAVNVQAQSCYQRFDHLTNPLIRNDDDALLRLVDQGAKTIKVWECGDPPCMEERATVIRLDDLGRAIEIASPSFTTSYSYIGINKYPNHEINRVANGTTMYPAGTVLSDRDTGITPQGYLLPNEWMSTGSVRVQRGSRGEIETYLNDRLVSARVVAFAGQTPYPENSLYDLDCKRNVAADGSVEIRTIFSQKGGKSYTSNVATYSKDGIWIKNEHTSPNGRVASLVRAPVRFDDRGNWLEILTKGNDGSSYRTYREITYRMVGKKVQLNRSISN